MIVEPLRYHVAAAAGVLHQELAPALSGEAQICETPAVVAAERETSPQASEQSIGKMNPLAPGWTRMSEDMFRGPVEDTLPGSLRLPSKKQ